MKNIFKTIAIILGSSLAILSCDQKKELVYKGQSYEIPSSALILNLADSISGITTADQSSTLIHNTFNKTIFGEYVNTGMVGEQNEHAIFEKVWFEGNTGYAKLSPNLTFHNGRKVLAKDVEFSITRFFIGAEKYNVYNSKNKHIPLILSNLKGYNHTIQNIHPTWQQGIFKGVKVVDEQTIAFHMQHKDLDFFNKLNMGYFPLVAQESLQEDLKTFKDTPIGTGPYKVVTFDNVKHFYQLEKTAQAKKTAPKSVVFVFTKEDMGDIKLLYNDSQKDSVHVARNFNNALSFTFNFKSRLGADPRFRAIFDLALDRAKIAQKDPLNRIEPDCQLIVNYANGYEHRIAYKAANRAKAIDLVQELKNEYKESFPAKLIIPMMFLAESDPVQKLIFPKIKKQLENVGLAVEFSFDKNLPNIFSTHNNQDPDLYPVTFFAKILVREEPMANFHVFIPQNNNVSKKYNITDDNDKILVQKYEQALKDPKYIKDFNEYFISKNIFVVVAHQRKHFYYNKSKISSLGDQSEGIFINISNIEM